MEHVILAETPEGVSLYFDNDGLRKNKKIISGIVVGRNSILYAFFIKKAILSIF